VVVLRAGPGLSGLDEAFAALADPTRRKVVALLAREELRAGELAERLRVAPPAMSKHLAVLRRGRLVEIEADEDDARAKIYRLRREGLRDVRGFVEGVERFWEDQLAGFKAHVERGRSR